MIPHDWILHLGQKSPADLAEYRTHWQLSIDGNLPGEIRADHLMKARDAATKIVGIPPIFFKEDT